MYRQASNQTSCAALPPPEETEHDDTPQLPVIIIGAGPVGLAAAAHLAGRGIEHLVLEAGDSAGAAVREEPRTPVSTWGEVVDRGRREDLLAPTGWTRPDPATYPSGGDWTEQYLRLLADVLGERVRTGAAVTGVSRAGRDRSSTPAGSSSRSSCTRERRRPRGAYPRPRRDRRLRYVGHGPGGVRGPGGRDRPVTGARAPAARRPSPARKRARPEDPAHDHRNPGSGPHQAVRLVPRLVQPVREVLPLVQRLDTAGR
ncbi:hypothetical protein STENM327S_08209 [Streptomyces tendae]